MALRLHSSGGMCPRHIPMECENASNCPLTHAIGASHALPVLRAFHCDSGGARCERRRRNAAGIAVPDDLLPDGRRLADTSFQP
jgi:hypothetical protein